MTHSPDVKMWLDCGDHGIVKLGRVTPKSVVAKEFREVPPCEVSLVVSVDGQESRSRVNLVSGFNRGRRVGLVRCNGTGL